jgi:hypothetical protein
VLSFSIAILCGVTSQAGPIRTNLWRQFGLPADQESMKQIAQKNRLKIEKES